MEKVSLRTLVTSCIEAKKITKTTLCNAVYMDHSYCGAHCQCLSAISLSISKQTHNTQSTLPCDHEAQIERHGPRM